MRYEQRVREWRLQSVSDHSESGYRIVQRDVQLSPQRTDLHRGTRESFTKWI